MTHTDAPGSIDIKSPYNREIIDQVPTSSPAHVERAVELAAAALGPGSLPLWRRAEILDAAAVELNLQRETFARTIALEAAKPISTARSEVDRAVSTFRFASAEARTLAGEMVPLDASAAGEGKVGFTLRVPVGVIGAITPFNFPLNLVVHKVAPAIAAGCPVVLKPASQTPLSSLNLRRLLVEDCGLPPDWLHVVVGPGPTVGRSIVEHPTIGMITFTGSPPVGWSIRAAAPMKRVGLELGNNAPLIIEPDGDWVSAAKRVRTAGFSHAGQSCISTQRILVQRSIHDDFVSRLLDEVATIRVGDPIDEETEMSSLISPAERDRVHGWIAEAGAQGANVALGGDVTPEGILQPTVITSAHPAMKVCSHEVFGPVVAIASYDKFGEALETANTSDFGLQAAVFTADLAKAFRAIRELDYGGVLVNEVPTWRADQQPYGGIRNSGNTREGPAYSVHEMTEVRLAVISS